MLYMDKHCPICERGDIGFLLCSDGSTIVLLCDECESLWLDPACVDVDRVLFACAPLYEVPGLPGCSINSSHARWASSGEVAAKAWSGYIVGQRNVNSACLSEAKQGGPGAAPEPHVWRKPRYHFLLWGHALHRIETLVPQLVGAVDRLLPSQNKWRALGRPMRPMPRSLLEWKDLEAYGRSGGGIGALSLGFDVPRVLRLCVAMDVPGREKPLQVLSIDLADEFILGSHPGLGFDDTFKLFTQCIAIFQPFWGRGGDFEQTKALSRVYDPTRAVDGTKVPATMHWLNYFDDCMLGRLGGWEKLRDAPCYRVERWPAPPGALLALQREPFDYHSADHRSALEKLEAYLGLNWLHQSYRRR